MTDPVPTNPHAQRLGMSGECGCLANATAGEADRWREAYPDDPFIKQIDAMEAELVDRVDIPEHRKKWGWGGTYDEPDKVERIDGLCSVNCGVDPFTDLMDPLFELEQHRPTLDESYCDIGMHEQCSGFTEDDGDPEICMCECHLVRPRGDDMKRVELSESAARELADILDDGYYGISPELEALIVTLRGDDQRHAAPPLLDDLL